MRQLLAVLSSFALAGSLLSFPPVATAQETNNYYEQALDAFNGSDFEAAYIHLKNRLQQDPNNLAAKILMGKVLLTTGYIREAEIEFNESLEFGADPNLVADSLGKALLFQEKYQQVLEKEFYGLKPEGKVNWTIIKATAHLNLNQVDAARVLYARTLRQAPANIKVLNALTGLEIKDGNIQQAASYLSRALTVAPDNLVSLRLQGELQEAQGNLQAAIDTYITANAINPEDPMIKRSLATAYIKTNQDHKAQAVIQEILTQTPDDPMALLLKSWLLSRQQENDEAKNALAELSNKLAGLPADMINNTPDLQYIRALSNYAQGSIEATRNDLAEYVAGNGQNIQAVRILVDVYMRLGDIDLAAELIKKYTKVLEQNLSFGLLACDLYIKAHRTHRAISLLQKLERNFGTSAPLVIMQAKTLSARGKVSEALALLESQQSLKDTPEFMLTRALILIQDEQFQAADKLADQLVTLDGQQTDYLNVKAITAIKLKDWSNAEQTLSKILSLKPTHYSARYNMVNVYAATGRTALAKSTIQQLLAERQDYAPAILLLAQLERSTGESEQALERVENLVVHDGTNISAKEQLVNYLIDDGDYDKALRILDELTKATAIKPIHISQQAFIYQQMKNPVMARRELTKLYSYWEKDPSLLRGLAVRQKQIGDINGARKSLNTALTLTPNSLLLQFELTRLDIEQEELTAAEKRLTGLPQSIKQDPNVLVLQGDIANARQQSSKAFSHYAAAVTADNSFSQAFAKLYQLASDGVEIDKFITQAEDVVNKNPQNLFYKNLLADFYLNQLNADAALKHYLELDKASSNPNKFAIFNNLANIYLSKDDLANAVKYGEAAFAAAPNHPSIVDTRGWLQAKQGNYEVALDTLRQAYSMNSNDPAIRYHLGYTLHKLGRNAEAARELQASLMMEANFLEREAAQALYDSL